MAGKSNKGKRLLPRLYSLSAVVLSWLGLSFVRLAVVGASVLLLCYVLFSHVWQPLRQEVGLPPGVTPTNPELNIPILKEINTQRVLRVQSTRQNFGQYNVFFVPKTTPAAP